VLSIKFDVFSTAITEGDLKKKMSQHVVETVKSNSEDENVSKSICGGDLRKKTAVKPGWYTHHWTIL
jgi:hypothetical protein